MFSNSHYHTQTHTRSEQKEKSKKKTFSLFPCSSLLFFILPWLTCYCRLLSPTFNTTQHNTHRMCTMNENEKWVEKRNSFYICLSRTTEMMRLLVKLLLLLLLQLQAKNLLLSLGCSVGRLSVIRDEYNMKSEVHIAIF